jgi:antirestriction protein ArdC
MKLEIPNELKGKELAEFLVEHRDKLTDSICQDPEELEKFVRLWDGNLGMHQYSINNTILAWMQYPQVSMLAGYKKWQSLGRFVRKGERAIKVLAPLAKKIRDKETDEEIYVVTGFKYVNVFDVNQTDGKNLSFGHEKMVKGNISFNEIRKISPLPVIVKYDGTSNGNVTPERILIAPKDNSAAMVACLIHEIAHYKHGHLDSDLDKEVKETEAECTSFIVCSYLGLDNEKSKYYVGAWNGTGNKLSGRKIISVAESIIRDIEKL